MTQIPKVEGLSNPAPSASSAVSINIYNPKAVNSANAQKPIDPVEKAPACPATAACQGPTCSAPIYSYPQAPIYEVPKQSIYQVPTETQPVPPPPVVIPPAAETISAKVSETPAVAKAAEKPAETKVADKPAEGKVPEKTVEVKEPEKAVDSKVDLNAFISKLTNPDYEVQANAMEEIAALTQKSPEQAKTLLDTKLFDMLLGVVVDDTTKLAGPTPEQLQIREKILSGKKVADADKAKANEITPMEQAERNKQYAMYTTAILQKLYISEIEKMNKTIIPFAEIPGAGVIINQIKYNPNPMIRASGIDALSYIQRPEYKEDLKTIFTEAQKDKDKFVQEVATKALGQINGGNTSKPAEDKTTKPAEDKTAKPAEYKTAKPAEAAKK